MCSNRIQKEFSFIYLKNKINSCFFSPYQIQLLQQKQQMNSIVPTYNVPGTAFSIAALAAIVPVMIMFKQYFRSLDFLQMSYFFSITMFATAFSSNLSASIANFKYNFLSFCSSGDLICTTGFQLSFGIVVAGFLLISLLFTLIRKCCKPELTFEPIYLFFKGFFKWIYLPLTYYSTTYLAKALDKSLNQSNTVIQDLIQAGVIIVICFFFPIFQLIGYKCIQQEKTPIWSKWLEFFSYWRLMIVGGLLGLYSYFLSQIYLHCVMVPLILYAFIAMWKGQFKYPVLDRILFGLGEAAFLANFYIFKYGSNYISSYDLDFLLLGFVLAIDLFYYLIRSIKILCYGINEGSAEVNPEDTIQNIKSPSKQTKKINKYDFDSGEQMQHSRESLTVNINPANIKNQPLPKKKK